MSHLQSLLFSSGHQNFHNKSLRLFCPSIFVGCSHGCCNCCCNLNLWICYNVINEVCHKKVKRSIRINQFCRVINVLISNDSNISETKECIYEAFQNARKLKTRIPNYLLCTKFFGSVIPALRLTSYISRFPV